MEVLAALAGAVVGAVVGYFINARVWGPQQRREETKRLAAALLAEAKTGLERYRAVFGDYIQSVEPGQPLTKLGARVGSQNFFAVFEANADKLGLFRPDDITLIVRAETLAKGIIEGVNQVSATLSGLDTLMHQYGLTRNVAAMENIRRQWETAAVTAGDMLRVESRDFVKAAEAAIYALERYVS